MANFNFKATESDAPGGGVYKLPGNGTIWKIYPADYPEVNLANLTSNNFFKRTVCNQGDTASVSNSEYYCLIDNEYHGGNTTISYSYSNGIGTVTVTETKRWCKVNKFQGEEGNSGQKYGSFTHTMYMSKDPIM